MPFALRPWLVVHHFGALLVAFELFAFGCDGGSSCVRMASRSNAESRMNAAMSGPNATALGGRFQM
jgi:hypothetical protein